MRDRPDDIPRLVAYFLKKFGERAKRTPPTLNPEALELLTQFPWPGNIRQLENTIERLIVINEAISITPEQLPEEILEYEEQRFIESMAAMSSLKELVKDATRSFERKAIDEALSETSNNVTHAARKLNISRKGLQLKMKELGLRFGKCGREGIEPSMDAKHPPPGLKPGGPTSGPATPVTKDIRYLPAQSKTEKNHLILEILAVISGLADKAIAAGSDATRFLGRWRFLRAGPHIF